MIMNDFIVHTTERRDCVLTVEESLILCGVRAIF